MRSRRPSSPSVTMSPIPSSRTGASLEADHRYQDLHRGRYGQCRPGIGPDRRGFEVDGHSCQRTASSATNTGAGPFPTQVLPAMRSAVPAERDHLREMWGSRKPIESARHVVKEHLGLVEYDEGYVVDPSSKLIWQRDGDDVFCDYADSVARCRNIRLGGFSDWRLPTKEELTHLARYGYADLQRVFPTIQRRNYWALTSPAEVPFAQNAQDDVGLTVDLDPSNSSFGDVVTFFKRSRYCVKAVRRYR